MSATDTIDVIASVASLWLDVEYAPRMEAMNETLGAPNRFTAEALHFAINQQMHELSAKNLMAWLANRKSDKQHAVSVLNPGNIPLAGLQDLVAVVISGHRYTGSISRKSPYLLPAFAFDLVEADPSIEIDFVDRSDLFDEADKVIITGNTDALDWAAQQAKDGGISCDQVLIRGPGIGVAILDGGESDADLNNLAEDILLHEGAGCRSVALIWAPNALLPDRLMDAMAQFRAVFPAHVSTAGSLEMQRAYLAALEASHAYSDDKSFLISRGDPVVQPPGHVRWASYDDPSVIADWLDDNRDLIQVVVANGVADWVKRPTLPFGFAQRPKLGWKQSGADILSFLCS